MRNTPKLCLAAPPNIVFWIQFMAPWYHTPKQSLGAPPKFLILEEAEVEVGVVFDHGVDRVFLAGFFLGGAGEVFHFLGIVEQ